VPTVQVQDAEINYDDRGSGPAVVFCHGWTCDRTHFAELMTMLEPGHRLIALDLPWHGESPASGEISIAAFTETLIGFLDALGVTGALLVGHSMGGFIIGAVAAQRPDLARGLVIIDSGFVMQQENQVGLQAVLDGLRSPAYDASIAALAEGLFLETDPPEVRDPIAAQMKASDPKLVIDGLQTMLDFVQGEDRRVIDQITVPTCFISATAPSTDVPALEKLMPDAIQAKVLAAGHWVQTVAPRQTLAMIEDFERIIDPGPVGRHGDIDG
jgi:pimeloyl-ACP methyl ester carboxylesterase